MFNWARPEACNKLIRKKYQLRFTVIIFTFHKWERKTRLEKNIKNSRFLIKRKKKSSVSGFGMIKFSLKRQNSSDDRVSDFYATGRLGWNSSSYSEHICYTQLKKIIQKTSNCCWCSIVLNFEKKHETWLILNCSWFF